MSSLEVPVAVSIKVMVFLQVTPCSLVDNHQCSRRKYCLNFRIEEESILREQVPSGY